MPFAQWGYPYKNKELFESRYPAQFISEAIDQTRGWFYTLMAVGTLVFDKSSYENVVCLGHILAEDGRKMSKHLGNILQPIPLMDQHGADAVRWFMAAGGSPWAARRVGHGTIQEVVRKTLLTYWNTVAFQALYARTSGWAPSAADPAPADRPVLDRWLLSELARAGGRGHPGAGELRHPARRQAALGVRRRPVQLVRPPFPPPLLAGRQGRAAHAARGRGDGHPADGAADAVHHGAGLAGPGRPRHPGRPGVGAPVRLAEGGPGVDRSGAVPADGAGAPPGGARPGHAGRVGRQDPAAALPRPGRRLGLRDAHARSCAPRSPRS